MSMTSVFAAAVCSTDANARQVAANLIFNMDVEISKDQKAAAIVAAGDIQVHDKHP